MGILRGGELAIDKIGVYIYNTQYMQKEKLSTIREILKEEPRSTLTFYCDAFPDSPLEVRNTYFDEEEKDTWGVDLTIAFEGFRFRTFDNRNHFISVDHLHNKDEAMTIVKGFAIIETLIEFDGEEKE
jgi:hypothetical protein